MAFAVRDDDGLECAGCAMTYVDACELSKEGVLDFLIAHNVLKGWSLCGRDKTNIVQLNREVLEFRCYKTVRIGHGPRAKCSWRLSARNGTFLEKSHLTPQKIFMLISTMLWIKPPRQEFLSLNFDISPSTISDWYSFFHEVCIHWATERSEKLGGLGSIVEIDEAKWKYNKKKYNRGRSVEGQWVFGGIERGTGKSFLEPVETSNAETLLTIIQKYVIPGSTVYSNCWKTYNCLESEGFQHFMVNHSVTFVDPDTGVKESCWRDVRSNIPRYGVRKVHSVGHLAEFQFKRKYPAVDRVHEFFKAAAALYPPSY